MITVIAEVRTKPGHREALLTLLQDIVADVLQEPGCISYQPLIDAKVALPGREVAPDSIFMLEQWESQQDLVTHLQSATMQRFQQTCLPHVVETTLHVLQKAD